MCDHLGALYSRDYTEGLLETLITFVKLVILHLVMLGSALFSRISSSESGNEWVNPFILASGNLESGRSLMKSW